MGKLLEAYNLIKDKNVTAIEGQVTKEDYATLISELMQIAYTILTSLGGGENGHSGLIILDLEYQSITHGKQFNRPKNPGNLTSNLSDDEKECAKQYCEHNALREQYETCIGTEMALCEKIVKAVPKAFLAGIWNKNKVVSHLSIYEILSL